MMDETQIGATCFECGFKLTIDPAPPRPWRLEHVVDATHRITPPIDIAAGTTIHAEGVGGMTYRKAFTFNHVGHPPASS